MYRYLAAAMAMVWALFPASFSATAEGVKPDRVYIPLATHHVNLDPADYGRTSWNEFNPGLVLTWENRLGSLDYSLGAFKNSYNRVSAIATVAKMWEVGEHAALGGFVGFADYGSDARYFDVTVGDSDVVVIPGFQMNYRNLFGQVIVSPQPGGAGAIFSMGATFPLSR